MSRFVPRFFAFSLLSLLMSYILDLDWIGLDCMVVVVVVVVVASDELVMTVGRFPNSSPSPTCMEKLYRPDQKLL